MAESEFMKLVENRRSCRRYDSSRPVPREVLTECVEAARLAPSACNKQPWRFVIVDDPELVARIRADGRRAGIPHPWWDDVPVFVVLCAELSLLAHRVAPAVTGIPYHLLDLGIAGEHFVLAAEERGLGTCWIGWFNARGVRRALMLPRRLRVLSLITVGYPAEQGDERSSRQDLDTILSWNGV
ncbi:MAG: nitroreductase family protein [Lentisphaeria bacterium]|nr:nitroreductase family protein [Lentisphaeria bacterium]